MAQVEASEIALVCQEASHLLSASKSVVNEFHRDFANNILAA